MRITCPNCKRQGRTTVAALTVGETMHVYAGRSGTTLEIRHWRQSVIRGECGRCGHVWQIWPVSDQDPEKE